MCQSTLELWIEAVARIVFHYSQEAYNVIETAMIKLETSTHDLLDSDSFERQCGV
jgi:hypothetical protein